MSNDWSIKEVALIVNDYFDMLHLELNYKKYNKTEHRKALLQSLNERTSGSIEFKHQNISAALINMGFPFIKGYQPRFNYQKQIVEKEISDYIKKNQLVFEKDFENFSSSLEMPKQREIKFEHMLDEDPISSEVKEEEPLYKPIKINYLEKEQNNRLLGEAGENLVIQYEKWRLINGGKEALADKIEWVSKEKGDGLGFDILSKNANGTDRYVEVKTTKLSKETPIYLTKTELGFANLNAKNFYLYRVYNFNTVPKFFMKRGQYESFCQLKPQTFKGYF